MNYLFFDIECATCSGGGKLCEFGYVLTNERFNEIERDNFLINPDSRFDDYVINNMLHHSVEDYKKSPRFPAFYNKIMSLFTKEQPLIVGHTTKGDIEHVGDDCVRYGLPFCDLTYVDLAELFKLRSHKKDATSLIKMCEEFGIKPSGQEHSALFDAEMTMFVAKSLAEEFDTDFLSLCHGCPSARFKTVGYEETVRHRKSVERFKRECEVRGVKMANKRDLAAIASYASSVHASGKAIKRIKGKSIAISGLFESSHYAETLDIIRRIRKGGARYSQSVKNCNVFITYKALLSNGEEVFCKKKDEVQRLLEKGKKIEILSVKELREILGENEEKQKSQMFK